jgi:hypothetical protein
MESVFRNFVLIKIFTSDWSLFWERQTRATANQPLATAATAISAEAASALLVAEAASRSTLVKAGAAAASPGAARFTGSCCTALFKASGPRGAAFKAAAGEAPGGFAGGSY